MFVHLYVFLFTCSVLFCNIFVILVSSFSFTSRQKFFSQWINTTIKPVTSYRRRALMNCRVSDVDECANGLATCGIGERCVNTEGSYRCSPTCLPGFRLRNSPNFVNDTENPCEDINECSLGLHNCNRLTHRCLNTNGSYICEQLTTTTTSTPRTTTTTTTTRRPYSDSRYKIQTSGGRDLLNNVSN